MKYPSFNDTEPLFIQIAQWLEDRIVTGQIQADEQIPSTTELSQVLKINPATVRKGVNLLVEKGLVYKKRGMGMYVAEHATEHVRDDRRVKFYDDYIAPLLADNNICETDMFLFYFNKSGYGFSFEEQLPDATPLKFQRMEGYCFPDTSEFYVHEDPQIVAQKILQNFDNKITATFEHFSITVIYQRCCRQLRCRR